MALDMFRKATQVLAVTGAAALVAAGCGSDSKSSASGGSGGSKTTSSASASTEGTTTVKSEGADLRIALERLLGEHAMLAQFATQKGVRGEKDFMAIAGALDRNSVELGDAIGSVYGDEAKQKFLDGDLLWRDHIKFFVDYTTGVAKNDKAAQAKAVGNLKGYIGAFSGFLSTATEVPQPALQKGVTEHVLQLKGQLDAYHAGDYAKAYALEREATHHMTMTGNTLAGAISKQKPDDFGQGDVSPAASDLRSTLGRLLGEHAILASQATFKGYSGSKDFAQIAAALDANSVELSKAIASVYGAEAGKQFLDGELLWRAHIGFFVDYTTALAKKDQAGQEKAVSNLQGYQEAFSKFLADATGAPQDDLRKGIEEHVGQLKGAIDAYAEGDYEKAYELQREAYHHMYMTGDTLAGAIVEQSPDKFQA